MNRTESTPPLKNGTWGRASNMRRDTTCPVCKLQLCWGDKYRKDLRTQVIWHRECEASQPARFERLKALIAARPTYVPTFPTAEWTALATANGWLS